jgi:AAA15 family ATPase/GTPase
LAQTQNINHRSKSWKTVIKAICPIGNIFKTVKAKNKIRGLGKIVSSEGSNPNKKNYIQITESTDNESPDFTLDDTASGYFETIGIFTALVIGNGNVIFLDEPALHLHPTKIKYFGRTLMGMSEKQVIVITHSHILLN